MSLFLCLSFFIRFVLFLSPCLMHLIFWYHKLATFEQERPAEHPGGGSVRENQGKHATGPSSRQVSSSINLFIHSFIHSYSYLFIHSYIIHTLIHSIIHSFNLFIHLFVFHSFIHLFNYLFICLFIHSCIHSFMHSFIHAFICLFIHLFIHLFTCLFIYLFIHSSWILLPGPLQDKLVFIKFFIYLDGEHVRENQLNLVIRPC